MSNTSLLSLKAARMVLQRYLKLWKILLWNGIWTLDSILNVYSALDGKVALMTENRILPEDEDVFVPVQWFEKPAVLAYSKDGYLEHWWKLPPTLALKRNLKLSKDILTELQPVGSIKQVLGEIKLSVRKDEAVLVERHSIRNNLIMTYLLMNLPK